MLPWGTSAEKDPYCGVTLSNESQAGSRQRQRRGLSFLGWEMAEGGETWCCLLFLCLYQGSAVACKGEAKGYVGSLGCYPHPFHLPCSVSSSLTSSGLPFHLSGLTLPPPLLLPRPPSQQLGLGSCSGGKTQIAIICQGSLRQVGDRCKINSALVTA